MNSYLFKKAEVKTYAAVTHSSLIHALITFSAIFSCFSSFLFPEKKLSWWVKWDDKIILSALGIIKQYKQKQVDNTRVLAAGEMIWEEMRSM